MKFVITGGHHNSALVVARELVAQGHTVEWIGHRRAAAGDTHDSAEYIEVTEAKVSFHNLVAGKSSLDITSFANIPLGLMRAHKLLARLRPDAVLSFGGYLGLAVSLAAYVQRVPVFLHEQTVIAGKANKLVARFAKRIYLTWESSLRYYPDHKSIVVGLPLRPSVLTVKRQKLFKSSKPTILVLCGKQGSHAINKLLFAHVEELLSRYNLIHQTGTSSVTGDYEKALALRESLSPDLRTSYIPHGYIGETDVATYMRSVDLVVGRSGAHTTYELGILGKKSVLIPFVHTHGREQLQNAHLLEKAKIARILPQSNLTYESLVRTIDSMLAHAESKALDLPRDASDRLIADILQHLSMISPKDRG